MFTRHNQTIREMATWMVVGGWVVAWAIPAIAAAPEPVTAERLTQLKEKATAADSYRADFSLTVKDDKEPVTLKGTITYQKPDRRRVEFENAAESEDVAQLVVSDGFYEWQYFPQRKTVYKTDWAKVKSAGVDGQSFELRGLHQPFIDVKSETVQFVGTRSEGKETLELYEAAPADALVADAPFEPGKVQIAISSKDGLTRQLSMTDADGREVLHQKYSKVQTGVSVKPADFNFTPPEDAEVIDISQDRIDAAGALEVPLGAGSELTGEPS